MADQNSPQTHPYIAKVLDILVPKYKEAGLVRPSVEEREALRESTINILGQSPNFRSTYIELPKSADGFLIASRNERGSYNRLHSDEILKILGREFIRIDLMGLYLTDNMPVPFILDRLVAYQKSFVEGKPLNKDDVAYELGLGVVLRPTSLDAVLEQISKDNNLPIGELWGGGFLKYDPNKSQRAKIIPLIQDAESTSVIVGGFPGLKNDKSS
jgi:hypothetical protein